MARYEEYFSESIKWFRKENNLTQKMLAEQLGYSEKTVSKWECGGAIPDIETLFKLSKVMGMSLESMLSAKREYFLGIDGGGTKTELMLVEEDGSAVRRLQTEGCNPMDIGFSAASNVLKNAIYDICNGISFSSVYVFAGIAGSSMADMPQRFKEFFDEFGFARAECDSDNRNIIAAGLREEDGISLILGTGVCVYRQKQKEHRRIGGWGYLIDEGGSGYNLGRDALHSYFCAEDGSGEKTLLTEEINKIYDGKTGALMQYIYDGKKKAIASFAPAVFAALQRGDKTAERILRRNMQVAAQLVVTASKDLNEGTIPVVLAGGLTKQPAVVAAIQEALGDTEKYEVRVLEQAPVYGAVELAKTLKKGEK